MQPTMRLTRKEIVDLSLRALFTAGITSVIYLFIRKVIEEVTASRTGIALQEQIKYWLYQPGRYATVINVLTIVYVGATFIAIAIVVTRAYRQIQLKKIIAYIFYMADGHYSVRVPVNRAGRWRLFAETVNQLMDNIEEAFRERRMSEESKDELINNLGHDIRTPLTSIIGYLSLIENHQFKSLDDILKYTHIAYTSTQRLEGLINDLFDYTQSAQSSAQLNLMDIPVLPYLEQLIAPFDLTAQEKGMTIEVQVVPLRLQAQIDPDKLSRVFQNLLTNAFKYGTGATYVRVRAHATRPERYQPPRMQTKYQTPIYQPEQIERWLIFEVRNNGELLPADELEAVFERSYRADRSRTSSERGSGLGLAIVRNFVHLHHGYTYATVEGEEMVFWVEIPQYHNQPPCIEHN